MTAPTVAFSYQRFSDPAQASGDSIRRQDDGARRWCERNGVRLDTRLTFRDLGRSAFKGDHLKDPELGGLAAFLALVRREDSPIPDNAFLIIESLDRLSRDKIRPALKLLLELTDHVQIVQLSPVEQVYGRDVEPMTLMMAIMELSRGHSESAVKSMRLKAKWSEAKRSGDPVPGRVPAWVERAGDLYHVNPTAAATVRTVFALARKGYGAIRIIRELEHQGLRPIGSSGRWNTTYVRLILDNPAVYGVCEYDDGTTIQRPEWAVVTEDEFFAAQAVRRPGTKRRGGSKRVYLFGDRLVDAVTGDRYHVHQRSKVQTLVYAQAAYKRGAVKMVSFPVEALERALCKHLYEIDVAKVLDAQLPDNAALVEAQLQAVRATIAALEKELAEGEVAAAVRVLRVKEREEAELRAKLQEAKLEAASPARVAWEECKRLIPTVMHPQEAAGEDRLRLRAAVNRVVSEIKVIFVGHGIWRLAFAQLHFADSHAFRDVVICYRRAHRSFQGNGPAAVRPEYLYTDTWTVHPLPGNDVATYAGTIVQYLKDTADEIDRSNGKRR